MTEGKYIDEASETIRYFKTLAETLKDVVVLIEPKEYRIAYINHVQPGYKKSDVLGAKVFDFVTPEHIELYHSVLAKVVSTKQQQNIEIAVVDNYRSFGKVWYECTITPIKDLNDEIEYLIVFTKDITELKQFDIAMRNKQEKLYAIINNTNDIILSIDKEYKLTEHNSVFQQQVERGFGIKELRGTVILNYIDPKKHQHLKNIYERVFKGEVVNDIESFETLNGIVIYFESSYHPIYNYNKEISGISVFSKNITERISYELNLKKALKEKEVLLSEIHHRIKNNLALVSSMLQLKEMNMDNALAKDALSDSRKRIKSTALVHEMLYKNDSFDNINVQDYITELFGNLNMNANILLKLEGDNEVLNLGKALPFGLMMHELMMNSIKHSFKGREQSQLNIQSTRGDNNLKIDYSDGSGFFPVKVDFYDTSTTGLMLIHTFIEQLNGSIKLVSNEPPTYEIIIPID
jgi:PAS domain S-box-containing protein